MLKIKLLIVGVMAGAMFCVALPAAANPLRFPTRAFYSAAEEDVDLRPLFAWWSASQNVIASSQGTNGPLTGEQLARLLPPRPLERWLHIMATNFATSGDGWTMAASLEDYPGHATNRAIFLKHPPGRDRVNFLWIQANAAQISLAISNAQAEVQTSAADVAAARARAQSFAPPGVLLTGDLATTVGDLNNVVNEDFKYYKESQRTLANLQATQQAMNAFVAEFDGDSFYKLDFFALDTGFSNGVLPVFDLGELRR
ncbi:MAG: hypothetical protein P4N60_10675 [Verrucomicrobiae bacterium]|nr:hypothetical protein [Verrucomicrobiae bacterium]